MPTYPLEDDLVMAEPHANGEAIETGKVATSHHEQNEMLVS
jgi:hypothetical protein